MLNPISPFFQFRGLLLKPGIGEPPHLWNENVGFSVRTGPDGVFEKAPGLSPKAKAYLLSDEQRNMVEYWQAYRHGLWNDIQFPSYGLKSLESPLQLFLGVSG